MVRLAAAEFETLFLLYLMRRLSQIKSSHKTMYAMLCLDDCIPFVNIMELKDPRPKDLEAGCYMNQTNQKSDPLSIRITCRSSIDKLPTGVL
jgi:hypothetical protein